MKDNPILFTTNLTELQQSHQLELSLMVEVGVDINSLIIEFVLDPTRYADIFRMTPSAQLRHSLAKHVMQHTSKKQFLYSDSVVRLLEINLEAFFIALMMFIIHTLINPVKDVSIERKESQYTLGLPYINSDFILTVPVQFYSIGS